jgi:hypothetical protein
MRKKTYLGIGLFALFLVAGILYNWYIRSQSQSEKKLSNTNNNLVEKQDQIPTSNNTRVIKQASSQLSIIVSEETKRKQVESQERTINLLMATPIVFHGKVIDEKGQPIEGATITLSPANKLWGDDPKYIKTSDKDGRFFIVTHGLGLAVMVEKKGYYKLLQSSGVYGYVKVAGQYEPHQHADNPAVFVLKKMSPTEPLIEINQKIRISKKGVPIQIDLTTGKVVTTNSLNSIVIETWVNDENIINPNLNIPYDWRCRISVPKGGITECIGGEFDFIAPENGYQQTTIVDMLASLGNKWRSQISKQYFLQLESGNYARINLFIAAEGSYFVRITSYLNPSGSRNLEFDPEKQINR